MKDNRKGKLVCCKLCGRDTRARNGICWHCCVGDEGMRTTHEYIGRKSRPPRDSMLDYEDDYGEESWPDDVYGGTGASER